MKNPNRCPVLRHITNNRPCSHGPTLLSPSLSILIMFEPYFHYGDVYLLFGLLLLFLYHESELLMEDLNFGSLILPPPHPRHFRISITLPQNRKSKLLTKDFDPRCNFQLGKPSRSVQCKMRYTTNLPICSSFCRYLYKNHISKIDRNAFHGLTNLEQL